MSCWCAPCSAPLILRLACCWQRKKDKRPAQAPTAEEFRWILQAIYDKVQEEYIPTGRLPRKPHYSFDNVSIHERSGWQLILSDNDCRLPLPPYSGDLHRVVEHPHGTIAAELQRHLYRNPGLLKARECQVATADIAQKVITPDSVMKDVMGLKELYMAVGTSRAEGGCEGGWPNKRLR